MSLKLKRRQPTLLLLFLCANVPAFVIQSTTQRRRQALMANLDKGFNLLETASGIIPQGKIVGTVKETWKFGWKRMMAELAPQSKSGTYQRPSYGFQGTIGSTQFPDEPGRYLLYVGNPCPWCHRIRLALALKDISSQEVGMTQLVDDPVKASRGGWVFSSSDRDPVANCRDLRQLYDTLMPNFKGRCTAPLLVDTKSRKIVSNESSDIVRMLDTAKFGRESRGIDLYPNGLENQIDETNEWIYRDINNGVYQCGFSTTQAAYDEASGRVRRGLERCEAILAENEYICGSQFTEADLRLLPTALRFDGVYAPLFKAGGTHARWRDFPKLHAWLRKCWAMPGVPESIDLADANASYYKQLFPLNPGGIIPSKVTAAELGLE